jgi:hypothetical protein
MKEIIMLARIARFSESVDNLEECDHKPLRLDELLTLMGMADMHGYSVKNACDIKSPQDEISSELYAVWYAKENEICIFADNIAHLIELTKWERSGSSVFDTYIDQHVNEALAA